jgi:hypothetical protein
MPIWLIIFGCLTIYNIRQSAVRARTERIVVPGRRTEGQLARMLILQIGVYIIFLFPFAVTWCMNSFVPSTLTPTITGIRNILIVWMQCDCFISFFIYVATGKVYREQLIILLKRIRCWNAQVHPNAPRMISTRRVF